MRNVWKNLTETDVEILNSSITDIAEKTEEKQKTLKEHHKDIVTCAEMFFRIWGIFYWKRKKTGGSLMGFMIWKGWRNLVFRQWYVRIGWKISYRCKKKNSADSTWLLSAVYYFFRWIWWLSELFSDKFECYYSGLLAWQESLQTVPAIRKYAEKVLYETDWRISE